MRAGRAPCSLATATRPAGACRPLCFCPGGHRGAESLVGTTLLTCYPGSHHGKQQTHKPLGLALGSVAATGVAIILRGRLLGAEKVTVPEGVAELVGQRVERKERVGRIRPDCDMPSPVTVIAPLFLDNPAIGPSSFSTVIPCRAA